MIIMAHEAEISKQETADYLQALYGGCERGTIVFVDSSRGKVSATFNVKRLDLATEHVHREPLDLFIKVNPMDHQQTVTRNLHGIGGKAEVEAIVSFHLDVDAGKDDKYLTPANMLDALGAMPLPPSMIIQTNGDDGGFHAYWLLHEPHYITDDADRQRCQDISTRWLAELRKHAEPGKIDGTANIDRILRPVGALRKSGNRVKAMLVNSSRRYSIDDFVLPCIEQPKVEYKSEPRDDSESIIEKYLDDVGLNSVESIISRQGYKPCRGDKGFWIRDGSNSGAPTGQIFTSKGKPGFTVKSGAADPLSCVNKSGGTGNWYSIPALYVAFYHDDDWKQAAKHCHEHFDAQKPKVDLSGFMTQAPATAQQEQQHQEKQEPVKPDPDRKKIFIKARRMDTVTPEKINWWWPNRIPRANLIMFAGQGGGGKSSVCCDLVARHTTGQPFPNDTEHRDPENVSIINCEDDAATIQRPRLDAAGADCSRVHLIDSLELAGSELWIDFANYSNPIEEFIVATKSTLLVVDPISGHIGGKKQNDTAEVREVLQKLQSMARRTGCTIVAITHSPKNATSAQSSIIGSQAFVSCARAAFAFVKDKDDPGRRIMLNAKSNYSADESGLAYRIVDMDGIGRVEWDDQPVTEHPDSFFTAPGATESSSKGAVDKAAGLLMELITDAMPKKDIDEWARAQMISGATLRRAKEKNGHIAEKRSDGWYWLPVAGQSYWNP